MDRLIKTVTAPDSGYTCLLFKVTKKITRSLPQPIQDYLSHWEYIARVGWTDDGGKCVTSYKYLFH